MNKIDEHLRCPICFEIPVAEIYQCTNGHHICSACCRQISECPSCRLKYSVQKIRNRAMETLLDAMEFECVFIDKGCSEKLHRSKIKSHLSECNFRPFHFCKLIGFDNCDFDANQIPRLTITHLQRVHKVAVRQADEFEICHQDFNYAMNLPPLNAETVNLWSPVLIKLDEDDYHTFMFLGTLYRDGYFSCICLYMKDSQKDASSFQVQLAIQNVFGLGKDSEFKWKVTPISFKKIELMLKSPPYRIPTTFFKSHAQTHINENSGGLKFHFKISKKIVGTKPDGETGDIPIKVSFTQKSSTFNSNNQQCNNV